VKISVKIVAPLLECDRIKLEVEINRLFYLIKRPGFWYRSNVSGLAAASTPDVSSCKAAEHAPIEPPGLLLALPESIGVSVIGLRLE
jgi:hypothetical protein